MGDPSNFSELVSTFIDLITLVIPLLFGVTLLVIVWRVVDAWIINGGDESKIEEGRDTIFVGIIALVVMSGIWGILHILQSSLFNVY